MQYLLTIIFMLTGLSTTMAAQGFSNQITSDEKCLSEDGKYYAIGESWSKGCSVSYCLKGELENQVKVLFHTCGVYGAPDGCNVTHDDGKDYPECCDPIILC